jgi:tetratricopeptide (TPR) repeat protein
MRNIYLHKQLLILIFLFLSGCTGIKIHSYYLKSSELFQNQKYIHSYFYAKQAVDGKPDNEKYVSMLAWTLLKQGRANRAAKVMMPFNQKIESIDMIQVNAWICYSLENNDKAIEWFQKELLWGKNQIDSQSEFCQSICSDAFYGMGLIYSRMKQYEVARQYFQKAKSYKNQFIGHRPIALAHAFTFFESKEYKSAQQEYQAIPKDEPDAIIDTQIAWCLYYQNEYSEAEMHLLKSIHEFQDKRPFLYGLIFSTYAQQKFEQSKEYLLSLIKIDPWYADTKEIWRFIPLLNKWADIPLEFAKQYGSRGNFKRGSQISQMILKQNPDHCEAQKIDIWCELYQSHAVVALSQFNQFSVNKSCDPVMGKLGQGIALMYLGYSHDATNILTQIPKDSVYYFRAQMALGAMAYLNGNFESAISIYEPDLNKLYEIKDQFWPFLNLNTLGWCYIYINEYQKAEEIFIKMNDMNNHLSGLHLFGLSWAKFKQGDTDNAIASLLEYNLFPYDPFKQSMLVANAFYLQSDYFEAIAIYEDNMSDLPENELFFSWGSFALQNLGWCYIYTHQYEKALETFQKLKSYHPAPINFNIHDNLGWGYYYQGLIDEAEKTFNQSLEIAPTSQLARDGLQQVERYRNRRLK